MKRMFNNIFSIFGEHDPIDTIALQVRYRHGKLFVLDKDR